MTRVVRKTGRAGVQSSGRRRSVAMPGGPRGRPPSYGRRPARDRRPRDERPRPLARYEDGAAAPLARAKGRQRALLTESSAGVACPVADGEMMGRLSDEGQHVSPRHDLLVYTTKGWAFLC